MYNIAYNIVKPKNMYFKYIKFKVKFINIYIVSECLKFLAFEC